MVTKWNIFVVGISLLTSGNPLFSQDPLETPLEILDNLPEESIEDVGDHTDVLELFQYLSKHPMNLNTITPGDLAKLQILNPAEIKAIMDYRKNYGPFIDPNELQVIPDLPLDKIRQLIPFLTVTPRTGMNQGGSGYLLMRSSGYVPRRNGFRRENEEPPSYQGSPLSILIKYRHFQSHNYSWGGSLEKDAGERFGFQDKVGFDHIHFHYFRTGMPNKIKTLALGDYRISLGQGLLQYQGFAITKSSNPLMVKRVAPVIQPYSGTSEYNYFRGAAIEIGTHSSFKNFVFIHHKKRDATIRKHSVDNTPYFSAFQTSGLHRTVNEEAKRNQVAETIAGHRFQWLNNTWEIGINSIYQRFSLPYEPVTRIDNVQRLTGSQIISHSLDFSGYLESLHVFGEVATQNYRPPAFTITGLYSFHSRLDAGVLIRRFPAYFAPVYGNAFSARSTPNNESGIYIGINYHFSPFSRLSFYLDSWKGLWPTFQAHGPTFDRDLFLRYDVSRRHEWEGYAQIKWKHRADNQRHSFPGYNIIAYKSQSNLRVQFRKIKYQYWRWTNRIEVVRSQTEENADEYGFMAYADWLWSPIGSWWSLAGRLAWFHTDSYSTRIYSYEPDIRYSFSIPSFYGKGWRIAARVSRKWRGGLRVELRTGWTFLPGEKEVGSGDNAVPLSFSQQVKMQVIYGF